MCSLFCSTKHRRHRRPHRYAFRGPGRRACDWYSFSGCRITTHRRSSAATAHFGARGWYVASCPLPRFFTIPPTRQPLLPAVPASAMCDGQQSREWRVHQMRKGGKSPCDCVSHIVSSLMRAAAVGPGHCSERPIEEHAKTSPHGRQTHDAGGGRARTH